MGLKFEQSQEKMEDVKMEEASVSENKADGKSMKEPEENEENSEEQEDEEEVSEEVEDEDDSEEQEGSWDEDDGSCEDVEDWENSDYVHPMEDTRLKMFQEMEVLESYQYGDQEDDQGEGDEEKSKKEDKTIPSPWHFDLYKFMRIPHQNLTETPDSHSLLN